MYTPSVPNLAHLLVRYNCRKTNRKLIFRRPVMSTWSAGALEVIFLPKIRDAFLFGVTIIRMEIANENLKKKLLQKIKSHRVLLYELNHFVYFRINNFFRARYFFQLQTKAGNVSINSWKNLVPSLYTCYHEAGRTHEPAITTNRSKLFNLNTTEYSNVGFARQHRPAFNDKPQNQAKTKYFALAG